jgi:NADH:ubiquinone oxidoreductase subunit E
MVLKKITMCDCLDDIYSEFKGKPEELIPILQRVQEKKGFLSEASMRNNSILKKAKLH